MIWRRLRELGRLVGPHWRRFYGGLYDGVRRSRPGRWLRSEDVMELAKDRVRGFTRLSFTRLPRGGGWVRRFNELILRSQLSRSRIIAQLCGRLEPVPRSGPEPGDAGVREPRKPLPGSGQLSAAPLPACSMACATTGARFTSTC